MIFHLLTGDIARDLRGWIARQDEYIRILQNLHLDLVLLIWSDDVAVPWAVHRAEDLVLLQL